MFDFYSFVFCMYKLRILIKIFSKQRKIKNPKSKLTLNKRYGKSQTNFLAMSLITQIIKNKKVKRKISVIVKTNLLAQLDMSFAWKPRNWRTKFTISYAIVWWFQYFITVLQIIFGSMLELADVGFLKAHLPTDLVPLTSTLYLGSRSEIIWSA